MQFRFNKCWNVGSESLLVFGYGSNQCNNKLNKIFWLFRPLFGILEPLFTNGPKIISWCQEPLYEPLYDF